MSTFSLQAWLTRIESLHPHVMDFDLSRFNEVLARLNLKCDAFIVTVAGTNGKGTTVAMLERLFSELGFSIGTYTSPHLLHFNERIRLNQKNSDDNTLVEAFEVIEAMRGDVVLTFFEFTTLAAFWLFSKANPDVLILEIGLGGRLDAVNAWDPDLSVITSIDLDHCQILGHTRELIAKEKAGIFREKTPIVVGDLEPPNVLKERANELGAPYFQINQDYYFSVEAHQFLFKRKAQRFNLPIPMIPSQNAATALMVFLIALEAMKKNIFNKMLQKAVENAFRETKVLGRFTQCEYRNRQVILEVGHNPHAARYLSERLKTLPKRGRILAVFGMLKDKDIRGVIEALAHQIDHWFLCDLPGERGEKAKTLQALVGTPHTTVFTSAKLAFEAAHQVSELQDHILVLGSFVTVAEILELGVYSRDEAY